MNEREELRKIFLDHPSASMPGLMEFSSTVPEDVEDVDSIIDRILAAGFGKMPEPEWEYLGGPNVTYRRTKAIPAGPWVPVKGEVR